MPTLARIGMAPVKSTRLLAPPSAFVAADGIAGDRRFLLLRDDGTQIRPAEKRLVVGFAFRHDVAAETLTMISPDGSRVSGSAHGVGEEVLLDHHGLRSIPVTEVPGPWADLLSERAGFGIRVFRVAEGATGVDVYPITLLTTATTERLGREAGASVDPARFRANLLIAGTEEHAEDGWDGHLLRIGDVVLRIRSGVPRCMVISFDPTTGRRDLDLLRAMATYRPRVGLPDGLLPGFRSLAMAVYAEVERPGTVRVGDEVQVLPAGDPVAGERRR